MLSETIINNVERKRVSRIARGSVSLQRGLFSTQLEWQEKRKNFPKVLKRVLATLRCGDKDGKS